MIPRTARGGILEKAALRCARRFVNWPTNAQNAIKRPVWAAMFIAYVYVWIDHSLIEGLLTGVVFVFALAVLAVVAACQSVDADKVVEQDRQRSLFVTYASFSAINVAWLVYTLASVAT